MSLGRLMFMSEISEFLGLISNKYRSWRCDEAWTGWGFSMEPVAFRVTVSSRNCLAFIPSPGTRTRNPNIKGSSRAIFEQYVVFVHRFLWCIIEGQIYANTLYIFRLRQRRELSSTSNSRSSKVARESARRCKPSSCIFPLFLLAGRPRLPYVVDTM
jgi:hypothetical protein